MHHENPVADDRIAQLEQRVAELTSIIERLAPTVTAATEHVPASEIELADHPTASAVDAGAPVASRRGMLKLAGAAAVGAVAATASRAMPVAADDDQALTASNVQTTTNTTRETTGLVYTNTLTPRVPGVLLGTFADANMFVVRDTPGGPFFFGDSSASSYPAAIGGYSYRTVANGIYGYTGIAGFGVVGYGAGAASVGVLARGSKANVELFSAGTAGPARADAHSKGELICDVDGNIWACVVAGTPGTWRKLAGPATGGSFHAITPARVFDSRLAQPADKVGLFLNATNRTISVADQRNQTDGAVVTANVVPAGATAITGNVTVADTQGAGFLAINPGGNTTINAAAVNWSATGQILNNGLTLTLNGAREVTIICGGGGNTHVIVDVTGYFL